jgi:hypothetical protein
LDPEPNDYDERLIWMRILKDPEIQALEGYSGILVL